MQVNSTSENPEQNVPQGWSRERFDAGLSLSAASGTSEVDAELFIRKAFDEDPQKGCELLFRLYYRVLCTHAVRFVYSRDMAEDLVADVFYTFWNTQAFRSVRLSYRSYLFRSVRNRAYNYLLNELKKNDSLESATQHETPPSDRPEPIMHFEELYHKVDELVATLPPQCQKVFLMNRFEGKKSRVIADELHLSVRTVEGHIAKALATLRNGLKDHWVELVLLVCFSF
ncbi:RNA polymerase sigma-70 factor (ECF subfamily) [Larkinella arboricola]|uniref:RNA polymerase sigma-70 factor (ECF subfamily) n=1 Tax=Larkinella arboricola TaxID=643671 RepID=A0A327WT05_LARAB|nr:RNA polymerase sigma-70 factor [Larkinella arboricola]RAJ95802.1 RNA polymerase sigma-70 factor (ECF subfamily) [Larkinella arboricola]